MEQAAITETKESVTTDHQELPAADRKDSPSESSAVGESSAMRTTENDADDDDDEEDDDEDETKLQEQLQTLKGDRIGETMYSERFVLSTILKLSQLTDQQLLEDDEEFERDLCNLWDMTIEPDVVRFLLQQEAVELFLALAGRSKDYRLMEILIGIVGNMCCVEEMHELLHTQSEILLALCDFLSIDDAPMLVQLMRTLTTLFDRSDDERYSWFAVMKRADNLTEKLSLILATSTNRALLEHTVETVCAIINRFTEAEVDYAQLKEFYRLFGKSCLLDGLFEAFRQLYPPISSNSTQAASGSGSGGGGGFEEDTLTATDLKTMRRFMEVHEHFVVHANELYEPHVEELVQSVYRVLVALCSESMLFPLNKNHISILVCVNNIYSGIMYHFHADSFTSMIRIYGMLTTTTTAPTTTTTTAAMVPTTSNGSAHSKDNHSSLPESSDMMEDDGGEFDIETASAELLEAIYFLVNPIERDIIRSAVMAAGFGKPAIEELCRGMREAMDGETLLHQTCTKLMSAFEDQPQPPVQQASTATE
uniref:Putative agap007510-pa-like protein n=1 Tax=Anopheles darlingi TaxID=43151 RepID=A0A2M4CSG4_ANODA